MNEQDRLYRLVRDIQATLGQCFDTADLAQVFMGAQRQYDGYRRMVNSCEVSSDWMEAMERELPFVERAVEEQRRFLRTRSEVVRIDRARGVCAESVKHLARHSNFITHANDQGEVLPDRLLVVEREDSYSIYENRFLFTLISLMQDFIEKRFRAVDRASGSVTQIFEMRGEQQSEALEIEAYLRRTDVYPSDQNEACMPEALCSLRTRVNALASTQLIKLLKGTPRVSSPIVRTNVIKKNPNFMHALSLYEFLTGYTEPGYESSPSELVKHDGNAQAAMESFCALAAVQAGVARLFADQWEAAELERRFVEENQRREQELLELEKQREDAVLMRIAQARREEADRYEAELAQRDKQVFKLTAELKELEKDMAQYRESSIQWENWLRDQAVGERQQAELNMRKLEHEALEYARKLIQEQAAHAETKENQKQEIKRQQEGFEATLSQKEAQWQTIRKEEREKAKQLQHAAEKNHREEIARVQRSADERLNRATRRLHSKIDILRHK